MHPPISINQCWKGRRFKTAEYKAWRETVGWLMHGHPKMPRTPQKPFYELHLVFYKKSLITYDSGNNIKAVEDALVDVGIIDDDRYILRHTIEKKIGDPAYFEFKVVSVAK